MNGILQDFRYTLRQLRKSPGFAAVALVTLALGIGANTGIFTMVNGVLLKPLPYAQPERLLMIWEKQLKDSTLGGVAPANFYDWREQSHSFDKMAAMDPYPDFILNGSGEPQRLSGAAVSSDFFSLFGTRMALGRDFLAEEDHPGRNQVVILSYPAWLHYFSGRQNIVGKAVTLNDATYTVIGVLPRDFSFVSKAADFQSRNHFDLWTPAYGIGMHPQISAFQRELLDRMRNVPGVKSAAFTAYLPLGGVDNSWAFDIEGRPPNPGVYDEANYRPVSAGYFETMGIPVIGGHEFSVNDRDDGPLVMIINQSMAQRFWKGQDPVGQRIRFDQGPWRTIVGIVGDVRHEALNTKPEIEMYLPYGQAPNVEARPSVVLRTSIDPSSLNGVLRKTVYEVDPNVPVDHVETMKGIASGSLEQPRFRTFVVLVFALLALLAAAVGLYGVMSYLVAQRTPEFGVRMALGASRFAVLRIVLSQSATLVGIGVAVGLLGAELFSRAIASLLYGVKPFDGVTLFSVSSFLVLMALLASYIPPRRAAKVDPMVALRYA